MAVILIRLHIAIELTHENGLSLLTLCDYFLLLRLMSSGDSEGFKSIVAASLIRLRYIVKENFLSEQFRCVDAGHESSKC